MNLPSLPEMVFGKNHFTLRHKPSGFVLDFSAESALSMVAHETPNDIKVAASHVWSESNRGQVAKLKAEKEYDEQTPSQDFDWTFTTHYCGDTSLVEPSSGPVETKSSSAAPSTSVAAAPSSLGKPYDPQVIKSGLDAAKDGIPLEKLKSTAEPILWFSHVHLFEDELHDNGIAEISTKSRVMNSFWFCLVRFWLRVDGVLFKVIDHRLYHEFGTKIIIKEKSIKEGNWDDVHHKVGGDLRKIRDPSEFAAHLRTTLVSLEHVIIPQAN